MKPHSPSLTPVTAAKAKPPRAYAGCVRTAVATVSLALVAALAVADSPRKAQIGRSVEGTALTATRQGPAGAATRVLVVGQIHGDEPAGVEVVRALRRMRPPRAVAVWTVKSLNPDGARRGIRQNARGIDLNRNFPRGWRPSRPGTRYYGGRRPLSQPESRAAARLVRRLRPRLTIWFHQPYAFVLKSKGVDARVVRRYARLARMPIGRLPRYPGTAIGWQNHRFPRSDALVVELPGGRIRAALARRHARAVLGLASWAARR